MRGWMSGSGLAAGALVGLGAGAVLAQGAPSSTDAPPKAGLAVPQGEVGVSRAAVVETDWTSPTLGEMKWIKPGTFTMGSAINDVKNWKNELIETQHQVTLTKGYWLMEHEVTEAQWRAVMGDGLWALRPCTRTPVDTVPRSPVLELEGYVANLQSYSLFSCGDRCPMEGVSWYDVQVYIEQVSARDGVLYRLPTEAEWEYAARGGQRYAYPGSDELDTVAWHKGNSGDRTHLVCQKQRNGYGLCDMSGNVWEWVQDGYSLYPGDTSDYVNNHSGDSRVLRGGGWDSNHEESRVAYRGRHSPCEGGTALGFRLARSP